MDAEQAITYGLSIIPVRADKRPMLKSWKEYQTRRPTPEEFSTWIKMNPPAWAMVTGEVSRIVSLDFDGTAGELTLKRLDLKPHRRTPSGGYHVDFEHPGWRVPTLNGKTKSLLGTRWPGLDIRGDGGYVIFTGTTTNGHYSWLQKFTPYDIGLLPLDLRSVLCLLPPSLGGGQALALNPDAGCSERLLQAALRRAGSDGRNNAGFWLACQLRDSGFNRQIAEGTLLSYAAQVPSTNAKGQIEDYKDVEALAAVGQAYRHPPRAPSKRKQDRSSGEGVEDGSRIDAEGRTSPVYRGEHYCFHWGGIWGFRAGRDGVQVPFKVTNFEATITSELVLDDGAEPSHWFTVSASVNGCPREVRIGAREFRSLNWVTGRLGGMAIVYPNQTEHARTAIQYLSREIPIVRSYCHTGWRTIEGEDCYLHAKGAIGASGLRTDVHVSLEETLPYYSLPSPPTGTDRQRAIRASLSVLDVAPDRITFPALAAVYRAILGPATFSVHFEGPTGAGKSQVGAVIQQHFGSEMDSEHLPSSWDDTALASCTLAFLAKDAVLVVDDFVLSGNAARQQKLHAEADRLFRSQANASGRRRLTTEGKLQSSHPPRGLIISTGEHTPRGKSLSARIVIIPFPKGAVNWSRLTDIQIAASRGDLASATAAYIQWVAPRLDDLRRALGEERLARRKNAANTSPAHRRTPENLESLFFGLQTFLQFARQCNAISNVELRVYNDRATLAMDEVARNEVGKHSMNDPALIFLRLVRTAISMGRAHLVSPSGGRPEREMPWGWQQDPGIATGPASPLGAQIGWVKGSEVCLDPEASFQIAAKQAHERGESPPGTLESVKRDLKEEKLVRVDEKRRTMTVRRRFQGEDHDVLVFDLATFQNASLEHADDADEADNDVF